MVAEDKEVYDKFPTPLINRLEKHFLGRETLATREQGKKIQDLKLWTKMFSEVRPSSFNNEAKSFTPEDAFMGLHDDAIASLALGCEESGSSSDLEDFVKGRLLQCATPDAVCRLSDSRLPPDEKDRLFQRYHFEQSHQSLAHYLDSLPRKGSHFVQVTTTSRLLSQAGIRELASAMKMQESQINLLSLARFKKEREFIKRLQNILRNPDAKMKGVLIVQSEMNKQEDQNLLECARYIAMDILRHESLRHFKVVFVIHVPRVSGGCFSSMCTYPWVSCHIDELRNPEALCVNVSEIKDKSIDEVLKEDPNLLRELTRQNLVRAASAIKSAPTERMSERLDILIGILNGKGSSANALFDAVGNIIITAIKDKTENSPEPKKWLVKMSSNSEFLREGNTFRKAVWLHLSNVLSVPLERAIQFCDTDCGLEWIAKEEKPTWKLDTFLGLLSLATNQEVCDILHLTDQQSIACLFPLSRYILHLVESWSLACAKKGLKVTGSQLQDVLEAKPHSNIIRDSFERGSEATTLYVHDFIHLKMNLTLSKDPNKNDEARDLFCRILFRLAKDQLEARKSEIEDFAATKNGTKSEQQDQLYLSPVDFHMAFVAHEREFAFLKSLCTFMPELPRRLDEKLEEGHFCLLGFSELLRRSDTLIEEEKWEEWAYSADHLQNFFNYLRSLPLDSEQEKLKEIEAMLRRTTVLQKYFRIVCPDEDKEREKMLRQKLDRLYAILNTNPSEAGKKLDKLVKFLTLLNNEVGRRNFGETDTCILCLEDLKIPVQLPCKRHWGCRTCLKEHFEAKQVHEDWICPARDCECPLPKDFPFREEKGAQEALERHRQFKGRLNVFFLEVLPEFVFQDNRRPEQEIAKKLLSFVVTQELPKDKNERVPRTKQISPFAGHCIDATPVIRSFILKLLLQGDEFEEAQGYLHQYLKSKRKFTANQGEHLELCLLIVFALEDRLYEKEEDQGHGPAWGAIPSKDTAFAFAKGRRSSFQEAGDALVSVAKARLAMNKVADELKKILSRKEGPSEEEMTFLDAISKNINDHQQAENMKRYLVRLLVRTCRRNVVNEWKSKNIFVALMPDIIREGGEEDQTDNCLVLGNLYKRVRDALSRAAHDMAPLMDILKKEDTLQVGGVWPLAVHSVYRPGRGREEARGKIRDALRSSPKPHFAEAMEQQRKPSASSLFPSPSARQQAILTVVFHLEAVLRDNGGSPLLLALRTLASNPTENTFLPTMPQDDTAEATAGMEGVKWYECSRGHIYAIGDCGRPTGEASCPDCGGKIGGVKPYV